MSFRVRAGAAAATAAALLTGGLLLVPAAHAATSRSGPLTGTELASVLLPTSYFPSGYKIQKSAVYNSGRRLEDSPAKYNLATFSCVTYLLKGLPETGFGETATAGNVIGNRVASYQQNVFQFSSPGRAVSFYQRLYAFTLRCRSISVNVGKSTATLTTQSVQKNSYPAFRALQTVYLTGLPATMNDTLVAVAGTDVFVMDAVGQRPPTKPALPTALLHLIARVRAA